MNRKSMKEIDEYCESVGAITNREKLLEVVPNLVDAIERLSSLAKTIKVVAKTVGELNEKCSKYVLEHQSVLDEGKLVTKQDGVLVGDLTIDGETYHFASGYGTPIRKDGEKLTQEFLATLPNGWVKAKQLIDTTAIKRLCGSNYAEQVDNYGLMLPVNNKWERKEIDLGSVC